MKSLNLILLILSTLLLTTWISARSTPVIPGPCPQFFVGCRPGQPNDTIDCTNDLECDHNQRCCDSPCNGKMCFDTGDRLKPGQCDDFAGIKVMCMEGAYENSTAQCHQDGDCPDDQKCCPQLCVKDLCKPPMPEPAQLVCPKPKKDLHCPPGQEKKSCVSDSECGLKRKCCDTGCGYSKCKKPVPQPLCGPVTECKIFCPFGSVPDTNGCHTCECNPDPCLSTTCPEGQHCEAIQVECFAPRCPPQPSCVNKTEPVCGPLCLMFCEFGNVLDERGCPICKCNPDPCENFTCPDGQHCETHQVFCIRSPCPSHVPVCENNTMYPPPLVDPFEKPGTCRAHIMMCRVSDTNINGTAKNNCTSDRECDGYLKCCSTPCSGMTCQTPDFPPPPVDPVIENPGSCPVFFAGCLNPNQTSDPIQCNNDLDCDPNQKCCDTACKGKKCYTTGRVCPMVCDMWCEYGNVLDENLCPTCQCVQPCQNITCSEGQTCQVQNNTVCVKAPCYPIGMCVNNASSFDPCPPWCAIACEFGHVLDDNGCPTCSCNPDPCANVTCLEGQHCEAHTVECFSPPCPQIGVCYNNTKSCPGLCKMFCEYGFVHDNNSCPICECVQPCKDVECGEGRVCKPKRVECVRAPCNPIGVCVNNVTMCPDLLCDLDCADGHVYDQDNCPTCECYYPCKNLNCSVDQVCRSHNVTCITAPCYPVGECVSATSTTAGAGPCPVVDQSRIACAEPTSADRLDQCGLCSDPQICCPHPCPGFGIRCVHPD